MTTILKQAAENRRDFLKATGLAGLMTLATTGGAKAEETAPAHRNADPAGAAEIAGLPRRDLVELVMRQGFYCKLADGTAEIKAVSHDVRFGSGAGVSDILATTNATVTRTFNTKGAFSILPAHRDGADLFTTDERLKLLSFTGSPAVGWALKAKAGNEGKSEDAMNAIFRGMISAAVASSPASHNFDAKMAAYFASAGAAAARRLARLRR